MDSRKMQRSPASRETLTLQCECTVCEDGNVTNNNLTVSRFLTGHSQNSDNVKRKNFNLDHLESLWREQSEKGTHRAHWKTFRCHVWHITWDPDIQCHVIVY
jgi:hypothetical protein